MQNVARGDMSVEPRDAAAQEAARIPLRDFFRNPEQSNFQISPDGRRLSFLQPWRNRMNIVVRPIADGCAGDTPVRATAETERDVGAYFWKGSDRLVYLKDVNGDENWHLVAVGADGRNLVDLTPFDGVRVSIIDDCDHLDDEMIVGLNRRDRKVFDVYRLDFATGQLTLLAENPGNITSWLPDHDGRIRVAVATDGVETSLLYRADDKAPFRTVITTGFREQIEPLLFDFDNRLIYAASNIGRDKSAIVRIDPATAREDSVIFSHPDVDVSTPGWSRKRRVFTHVAFTTWKRERAYLDPMTDAMYRDLERQLPGYEVIVQSHDRDERMYVVAAWSDRGQGTRYLYDATTQDLAKLADITPWLDESQLAEMKPISYQARDGLTIHGYLTLPRGGTRNLPMVVFPHGGPWARNAWGYLPDVQFLASRGYAVLQMNFRGSTGYGRAFWAAGFKEWGRKMQDDVSDGVKYAIAAGVADPARVAIYGRSYGGYAALAGLAFTPELYACGIDFVGISSLLTFMNTMPPYWTHMRDMFHEMVGHPEKDRDLLAAASPALHADRIRAPLFIAQGARDPRVNIEESNQMVAALQARGVAVDYMVKDNEGHSFQNEENRLAFFEAMEGFLEKHLGR
jgi:dipeptidyl aminopeptidase/acylaminoacyl peptidase